MKHTALVHTSPLLGAILLASAASTSVVAATPVSGRFCKVVLSRG
jgi:hypothetical protein